MNFWNKLKDWFKEEEQSSPTKPFVKEWLERTEEEKQDLLKWKLSDTCLDFCSLVYDSFSQNENHPYLTFLKSPYSSGFSFNFQKGNYKLRDAQRFMDFLREKVLDLNYIKQMSDYRLYTKNGKTERIERFYQKPRVKLTEKNQMDQLFGNVIIELTIREEEPLNLKFQVNRYSDRNYTESQSFEKLMEGIFL